MGEHPAENEAPTKAEGTIEKARDDLVTTIDQAFTRAQAAGLSPLKEMLRTYAKRGFAALDGFLAGLEGAGEKTKKE